MPHDMDDDEWMSIIAPRGWVVLSQDRKWHLVDAERAAVKQHGLKCIYMPSGDRWEILCLFTRFHGKLISLVEDAPAPCILELLRSGAVREVEL